MPLNRIPTSMVDGLDEQLAAAMSYEIYLNSYSIEIPETNDTGRFQRALNDLVSNGGGRLILEKNFTYTTSSDLTWKSNNIQIICPFGTTLKPVNCNGLNYGDSTATTRYNYTSIVGLKIDMSNALSYKGIISNNVDEEYFTNVIVSKGSIGIFLNGSYNETLLNVICDYQTTAGLKTDCTDKLMIIRGQFGNGQKGMLIQGGKAITLLGVSIERNNDEAINLASSMTRGGEYPQGLHISGCYMERNCQVSGNGYINYGVYNSSVNDYCKNITLSGNYFNWDTANPRSPVVPIHYFDASSAVTLIGNDYSNTSTYSSRTANTDLNRIVSINDLANSGRMISKTTAAGTGQIDMPFNVSVATDATGHGTYNYDLTSMKPVSAFAIGNPQTNFSSSTTWTTTVSGNTMTVTINNATANSTVQVTGVIYVTQ